METKEAVAQLSLAEAWRAALLEDGRAANTAKRSAVSVRAFVRFAGGEADALAAGPELVAGWLASLEVSEKTRRYRRSDVAAFFRWAVASGLAEANPVAMGGRWAVPPLPELTSVGLEWQEAMQARGFTEATLRRRSMTLRRAVREFGSEAAVLEASPAALEAWLLSLQVAPHSRGMYLGDLAAFFRWAKRRGLVEVSPVELLEGPKQPRYRPRPIGSADLDMALALAPPRTRTMLTLAAFAGLRIHEVTKLASDDIDWERGLLRIRGKGGRVREVPIHARVAEVLGGMDDGLVVRRRDGGAMSPTYASWLVRDYLRGLAIDATAHQLRHWFGTRTYAACRDLRVVQELLGHASPSTTAVYVAFSEAESRSAVESIGTEVAR